MFITLLYKISPTDKYVLHNLRFRCRRWRVLYKKRHGGLPLPGTLRSHIPETLKIHTLIDTTPSTSIIFTPAPHPSVKPF